MDESDVVEREIRVAVLGDFDVDDLGPALSLRVARAELTRRAPHAGVLVVRAFAPVGWDRPTRLDGGEPAEPVHRFDAAWPDALVAVDGFAVPPVDCPVEPVVGLAVLADRVVRAATLDKRLAWMELMGEIPPAVAAVEDLVAVLALVEDYVPRDEVQTMVRAAYRAPGTVVTQRDALDRAFERVVEAAVGRSAERMPDGVDLSPAAYERRLAAMADEVAALRRALELRSQQVVDDRLMFADRFWENEEALRARVAELEGLLATEREVTAATNGKRTWRGRRRGR